MGCVASLDGLKAVVGEGGAFLVVLGSPEGDDFFWCKEGGIVAVSFGGANGVGGPRAVV